MDMEELTNNKHKLVVLMLENGFLLSEADILVGIIDNDEVFGKMIKRLEWLKNNSDFADLHCFGFNILVNKGLARKTFKPIYQHIIYLGETNFELNKGDYYPLVTNCDYGKIYEVYTEADTLNEFNADLFVLADPHLIRYKGGRSKEHDSLLEKGKTYYTKSSNSLFSTLENGIKLNHNEYEVITCRERPKYHDHTTDHFLNGIYDAFSYGDTASIRTMMDQNTIYKHIRNLNNTITGRDELCETFQQWFVEEVNDDDYTHCSKATLLEDFESFKKGEKFVINYHTKRQASCAFVTHDGQTIQEILVFHYLPKIFAIDKLIYDKIDLPHHNNDKDLELENKETQIQRLNSDSNLLFRMVMINAFCFAPYCEETNIDNMEKLKEHVIDIPLEELKANELPISHHFEISRVVDIGLYTKIILVKATNDKKEFQVNFIALCFDLMHVKAYTSEYFESEGCFRLCSYERCGHFSIEGNKYVSSIETEEDFLKEIGNPF